MNLDFGNRFPVCGAYTVNAVWDETWPQRERRFGIHRAASDIDLGGGSIIQVSLRAVILLMRMVVIGSRADSASLIYVGQEAIISDKPAQCKATKFKRFVQTADDHVAIKHQCDTDLIRICTAGAGHCHVRWDVDPDLLARVSQEPVPGLTQLFSSPSPISSTFAVTHLSRQGGGG